MGDSRTLLDADEVARAIRRMSHELLERNGGAQDVILLGIITRGVPLAHRVARAIADAEGVQVPIGELDITMYRDDLRLHPTRPVGRTVVKDDIQDAVVVLVDDVLNSGRTAQAALQAVADLGRPRRIQLMVLIDRGLREVPIQADIVGKAVPTAREERVTVKVAEIDGTDEVLIERGPDVDA